MIITRDVDERDQRSDAGIVAFIKHSEHQLYRQLYWWWSYLINAFISLEHKSMETYERYVIINKKARNKLYNIFIKF